MGSARRLIAVAMCVAGAAGCSEDKDPIIIVPSAAGAAGTGGTGGAGGAGVLGGAGGGCSSMLSYADVQPILGRCGECHDDDGDSGFDARTLAGLLSGGEHGPAIAAGDCANSILYQKTGTMPPFGARMPLGGVALTDTERETICAWIDQGAIASAAPCSMAGSGGAAGTGTTGDITPPSFEGVDRVEEQGDGCDVSWEPAEDDVTAASAVVYEIFVAPEDGAIDLSMPALTTAPGATTAHVALAAGQDYDVVVIARDEAGNRSPDAAARECSLR